MTTDTVQSNGAPEAELVALPRVRMDKSRSFSTIHGDRQPSDPMYGVSYRQDGIPCDAEGYFLFDHPDMRKPGKDGDKARKMAEKHIKRALAAPPKPVRKVETLLDDDDDEVDGLKQSTAGDDDDDDGLLPAISLAAWLRGDQDAPWSDVSQEIARTYKRRVGKVEDAVAFLVKEGVCPKDELRAKFKKYAD